MFFLWMFLIMLAVIGVSVLAGMAMMRRAPSRDRKRKPLTNAEKMHMAKAAGAFPHRKES